MPVTNWLTTEEIESVFTAEICAAGGTVSDVFNDGHRMFARSVFPATRPVARGDLVQGGVALRATDEEIEVYPYVFRQVCRNGAIMARAFESQQIARHDFLTSDDVAEAVCGAVQSCRSEESLVRAAREMSDARNTPTDLALNMLPMLTRMPSHLVAEIWASIAERFDSGGDRSRFGLMNAVTSLARDTRDPELRWRLEELGGGVPARLAPAPRPDGSHAEVLARA